MVQRIRLGLALVLACGLAVERAHGQTPLGSAFTYQGRLGDAGTPANGPYDFRFVLFDAPAGGAQVGPVVTADNVFVTQGLFTVTLDFGAAFAGNRGWLEVGVRAGASTGAYDVLPNRQELTASPNALFSRVTPWNGVSGKPAGFADGIDNDALGALSCTPSQIPKFTAGVWACAADLNTTYTAAPGGGLSVSSNQFSIASNGVGGAMILDGTVGALDLGTDSVGTDEIAAGAVGSSELAVGGVTLGKIAADAVSSTAIATGAVGVDELANNAVGTLEIVNGSVTVLDLNTADVDARYLETDEVLTGANYGGCGTYALMPCNVFIPGTQAPACNAVPVGGICRVSSAGSVCAGTIGGTCGDLSTYYLKISP